ncbi:MAG: alpha/beta hydrolase [Actinomycetota bacterium]|nr:alpha/beta hydrolase [Actinomycetota bacterium]
MRLAKVIGFGLVVACFVVGGLWMLQDRLVYFPGPDPGPAPETWEEHTVETGDGLALSAWFRIDDAAVGRPLVIVLPGNAGNRSGRVPLGNHLADAGYGVVLGDYRGYGGNPGTPSEDGLISDALAIARAARGLGLDDAGIVYFGESLGAAVAIGAASAEPPDALVLGSPFTSLVDVGRHHYPWLPVGAFVRDRYASLERIKQGEVDGIPVLVIGGTADRTVPIEQSRAVAEALGATIHEVPGADHNDPSIRSAESMVRVVSEFIDSVLGG